VRNASAPIEIADDPDYCLYRVTADAPIAISAQH
jgi:hypothetical protein